MTKIKIAGCGKDPEGDGWEETHFRLWDGARYIYTNLMTLTTTIKLSHFIPFDSLSLPCYPPFPRLLVLLWLHKKHQHCARWIPIKCVYVKFVNEYHFSISKSWIRIKILYMFAERKVSWDLVWYGHCALNLEGLFQSVPGASLFPMQNKIKLWDNIDTTLKHLWETCVIIWWFLAGGTIFLWAAYSHFYDQSRCFSDRKSIWQIGIFSKEQSTIADWS